MLFGPQFAAIIADYQIGCEKTIIKVNANWINVDKQCDVSEMMRWLLIVCREQNECISGDCLKCLVNNWE